MSHMILNMAYPPKIIIIEQSKSDKQMRGQRLLVYRYTCNDMTGFVWKYQNYTYNYMCS